jgi:molybdenum cofactor cytidylyltransferase
MGRNKMFLEMGGEALLHRVVRVAAGAGLSPLMVVLGHEAARARSLLGGLPCQAVVNADYLHGIQSSVRAGVEALPDTVRAAVVVLADMPLVSSEMIATLVTRYRAAAAPLVLSSYGDVDAPPTLYDRSLFPELITLAGPGCGSQVVKRHRHEAVAVAWPVEVLNDLDEPGDVERLTRLLAARNLEHAEAIAGTSPVGESDAPGVGQTHSGGSADLGRK